MMKKLTLSWDGIQDSTGYMFSFAKALCCAVKNSPYNALAEEIIASSGFAFRMWISQTLCPSATSIWTYSTQKTGVENGGLSCSYIERLWGQDDIDEQRRRSAITAIQHSIDSGIAAISWDIGVCEWGLITGYDDQTQKFATLSVTGSTEELDYALLGKREIPILNVLTITGKTNRTQKEIFAGTLRIAKNHLLGKEPCENVQGLAVYSSLIKHFENENHNAADSWNMEYFLGTYAPLKQYAWLFFEKYRKRELAEKYKTVYKCWQDAFDIKRTSGRLTENSRKTILTLLKEAEKQEKQAVSIMI